jgi:hypothetical protein
MVQGRRVEAELYKVLIYREGDFFKWHWDSKKSENHIMTLCIDVGLDSCEGGELNFRDKFDRGFVIYSFIQID